MTAAPPTARTIDLIKAIAAHGVRYRLNKSLCIETPDGVWTPMAEDLEQLVAYIQWLEGQGSRG